ncbi:unnamed protein product [Meganyctiphanes norvegica]|uniref:UNC93-like protein MFSD11 n=1 Tax=Meganyctiphanes norvegica TaxID=48144 RepID=A0AAV2Q967_MEGNR
MKGVDLALRNVLILGVAFMLVFTSFQTQGNMQQVVIKSIQHDDPTFQGSGYISLAVIYAVFATFNWLSPSCLSLMGPKLTMIIGGITYGLFIASFLWPQTWLLYTASILVGAGAALIWTGQGNYLTLMSDQETISRNSGIFWAMLQSSFLFGNLFVFYMFRGLEIIDYDTRVIVFSVLTVVAILGIIVMIFLPQPGSEGSGRSDDTGSPAEALRKSFRLFKTTDMLLLSATFFYTGIELSFFSGVYSACISFTSRFADAKKLVGLSGIFIGIGEILGGATFGIFGSKTVKYGRDPIVVFGYLVHIVCYFLIFINLPTSSPFGPTKDPTYLPNGQPSEVIALLCSFLLGLGDSCFNTQIYSILGAVYSDNSGPAFALFKFVQSTSAAACFFYSSVMELKYHLIILVIFGTIGTGTFCLVQWRTLKRKKANPDTVAFD